MSNIPLQFPLPSCPPSRAELFEELFLSHYIESFGNPSGQPAFWFDRLPELLVSPIPSPVKHSIRAVSMVFYGILTGNISIQTNARGWYARAVRSLRSLLRNKVPEGIATTVLPTDDLLCAPIMLAQFEVIASTSPVAWTQHIEAAVAMLANRGPKNCSIGLGHQMFLTVRLFTVGCLLFNMC